jgi:hypothetical protein
MMITKAQGKFSETAIDDEIVVMSLESGDFFSLSGAAREIWLLIDGTRDRAGLIADLASDFGLPEQAIAADVDDFLDQLRDAFLITGR